ncbi:MAG: response regulator [Undibacterium sp.]|nr:response regulator [Opitutaceae bacterium]
METPKPMPALPPIAAESSPPPGARATVFGLGQGTLLLVEDQDFIAGYLAEIFTRAGLAVVRTSDGAGALRVLAEQGAEVRLAMIDHGLPDMQGDELCVRLRGLVPGLPVMLTSGRELEGCREKLALSGPTWFAAKPYRTAQLVDQVRALMMTAA